jgi:hypothetical protein
MHDWQLSDLEMRQSIETLSGGQKNESFSPRHIPIPSTGIGFAG